MTRRPTMTRLALYLSIPTGIIWIASTLGLRALEIIEKARGW